MKKVTYAKNGPFSAIAVPLCDPSVTLARGESAVVSDEAATALKDMAEGLGYGVEKCILIEDAPEQAVDQAEEQKKGKRK